MNHDGIEKHFAALGSRLGGRGMRRFDKGAAPGQLESISIEQD